MPARDDDVVWSSLDGDRRRRSNRPAQSARPAVSGRVTIRRETSGRRGKAVTTVSGLRVDDEDLRALAALLKKRCGVGGAVKDRVIELQGDHRAKVLEALRAEGHDPVLAGG